METVFGHIEAGLEESLTSKNSNVVVVPVNPNFPKILPLVGYDIATDNVIACLHWKQTNKKLLSTIPAAGHKKYGNTLTIDSDFVTVSGTLRPLYCQRLDVGLLARKNCSKVAPQVVLPVGVDLDGSTPLDDGSVRQVGSQEYPEGAFLSPDRTMEAYDKRRFEVEKVIDIDRVPDTTI